LKSSHCESVACGAVERGEKNLQLSTLERECVGLDVPIWEVIREAERANVRRKPYRRAEKGSSKSISMTWANWVAWITRSAVYRGGNITGVS
jgi:hypothetical protein